MNSDVTFDWVDINKYLSDYDNSVEQNDNAQRKLERIAPKCPHYFLTSSVHSETHNYDIIIIIYFHISWKHAYAETIPNALLTQALTSNIRIERFSR